MLRRPIGLCKLFKKTSSLPRKVKFPINYRECSWKTSDRQRTVTVTAVFLGYALIVYVTMSQEIKPYSYFTAPDGYEVPDKLLYILKPAALIGVGASIVDTFCLSHPKGYVATFGRYVYLTTPAVAAGATFVAVSNISGSIRKKDDALNWFVGGFASGSVLGAYFKSYKIGMLTATAFGLLAMGLKVAHLNNFKVYNDNKYAIQGRVVAHRLDWTLTSERPRNWTTGTD